MNIFRSVLFSFVFFAAACAAAFQSDAQYSDSAPDSEEQPGDVSVAKLQVKITELEDQIRKLRGSVEQAEFQNQQLKAQIEKNNTDVQYRLDALEKKQAASTYQPAPAAENPAPDSGQLKPVEQPDNTGGDEENSADQNVPAPAASTASVPMFATPREHYNYAFKLLNQAKYQESGDAFAAFTKRYPKDPLIGNAWYWLGETYYVQRDYVRAADDFRQGYESMPTGPKAPDNLLKLAMSLNNLKKDKEACIILKQVVVKFGNSSSSMRLRAGQEMNTIGCNE